MITLYEYTIYLYDFATSYTNSNTIIIVVLLVILPVILIVMLPVILIVILPVVLLVTLISFHYYILLYCSLKRDPAERHDLHFYTVSLHVMNY